MSNDTRQSRPPLVPLARMWAKQSAKGTTYYVGRMGGARVMLLENTRRQNADDNTHTLVVCEAGEREGGR